MKVGLSSFPANVYVCLKDDFRAEVFKEACGKAGSWANLARYLRVRDSNISGYRNGKFALSLKICCRLSKLLRIGFSDFESKVAWIGSHSKIGIKNPKLPFVFNTPAGARFVMAILCDGSFSQDLRPTYYNFYTALRKNVILIARDIFGDIRVSEMPRYGMVRFPKIVGYTLLKIGIRPGDKTCIDPAIPYFIKYGDKNICESAIGQIISDEGSIDSKSRKVRICFCKDVSENPTLSKSKFAQNWMICAPNLLKDSMVLLRKLKIKTSSPRIDRIRVTKKARAKIDWTVNISGHKNLFQLVSIPIAHAAKQTAIIECTNISRAGKNESLNNALAALWRIQKEVPYFTNQELSTELKISKDYSKFLLRRLRALGYIKDIKRGSPITPWKYSFTHRGEEVAKS